MSFVVQLAYSILGIYGAVYIGAALFTPGWFLDRVSAEQKGRAKQTFGYREPRWIWLFVLFNMVAVGVIVHAAAYAVVAVIPASWGTYEDGGVWISTRSVIQIFSSIAGGLLLTMKLENVAEMLVGSAQERNARDVLTRTIVRSSRLESEERCRLADILERDLEPDPQALRGFALEYARELQRSVGMTVRR